MRAVVALLVLVIAPPLTAVAAASSRVAVEPVVIAVVDGGLNAYHSEFRAAGHDQAPDKTVHGYPRGAGATPLRLSLGARDYDSARSTDDQLWKSVQAARLYWVPGTRIIGLVYLPGSALDRANEVNIDTAQPDRNVPLIDAAAHGTPVSSLAVGRTLGACRTCLLVHVAASNQAEGLAWAAAQPWIDIVTNSWGDTSAPGVPADALRASANASKAAHSAGKVVLFASGNGLTGLSPYVGGAVPDRGTGLTSAAAGPPWVVSVGGHDNGQPTAWHNVPPDIIARAQQARAASPRTLTGTEQFFGTSAASPAAAGTLGRALQLIRARPSIAGTKRPRGALAAAKRNGTAAFADGILTQDELTGYFLRCAVPPAADDPYVIRGWGRADDPVVATRTAAATIGTWRPPARPSDEQEYARMQTLRHALWDQ